jgi:hypothetical protein
MLRAIALDGTVSCQPLYSAGAGLALSGATNTISLMACASGKVLKSNGTDWVCSDDAGSQSCGVGEVLVWNGTKWDCSAPYALPVATTNTLGGVKQGAGVFIAADGTLGLTACASGQVLKSNGLGGYTCQGDTDTTYSVASGSGLTLTGVAARALWHRPAQGRWQRRRGRQNGLGSSAGDVAPTASRTARS